KGVGILFVRDKVKIQPIIHGGGQQNNMRSGTENIPGIAGLGAAVSEIYTDHTKKIEHLYELKEHFIEEVQKIDGVCVNGVTDIPIRETAPHVVSVSFEGIRAEVLLHALEEKNIYVSSGSACASNHPQLSGTLQAIGVKRELLDSTIRFSFSVSTTMEEIDYALDTLKELLPVLRKFRRY
ncbi:MAG: aminotransferase class V-fold PLP-dependent enzyme, partial [Clostridium sp.]|nr:aminotransferase class V-fold PLP-dependent enzyme [Clostridium sp.]